MLPGLESGPKLEVSGLPSLSSVLQLATAQGGDPATLWTPGVFSQKAICRVMSAAPGIHSGEAWAQDRLHCAQ